MSKAMQLLGSKISLISKSEIRYEGILFTLNPNESTLALAKGKSLSLTFVLSPVPRQPFGVPFIARHWLITIFLYAVRMFGTENRSTDNPVAPREEVFEFIIFRGQDIKDIRLCEPPTPQPPLPGTLPYDPAIVQVIKNWWCMYWPRSHWDMFCVNSTLSLVLELLGTLEFNNQQACLGIYYDLVLAQLAV